MNDDDMMGRLAAIAPHWTASDAPLVAARAMVGEAIAAESSSVSSVRTPGRRAGWGRWLVAAAAAGVLAVTVVVWPSGGSDAYASWTPTSTTPTVAQLSAATGGCEARLTVDLADWAATEQKTGMRLPHAPDSVDDLAGRSVLVAEQRGAFTLVVSSNARWLVECLAAPTVSSSLTGTTFVDLRLHAGSVGTGDVDVLNLSQEGSPDTSVPDTSVAVVYGRVGADVTGVGLATADGGTITGTVSHGYWTAWWPADPGQDAGSAVVTVHRSDGTSARVGTVQQLSGSDS